MPIYSKNRPVHTPVVSESKVYGSTDAGVVLYESCVNDHMLFNAMIDHDMKEITAIKEGTILEAEIESLNEEAGESLIKRIVDKFEGLWKKIKDMLGDFAVKVASYVMKNGKVFAKRFKDVREEYNKEKKSDAASSVLIPDFSFEYPEIPDDISNGAEMNFMDTEARVNAAKSNQVDKTALIKKELGKAAGNNTPMTPDEFRKYINEHSMKKAEIKPDDKNVDDMLDYLENAKTALDKVKAYEKEARKSVDSAIKIAKKNKGNENYATSLALATATEQVLITITREAMTVIRNRYSVSRKALGTLMANMRTAMNESATYSKLDILVEASIEIDEVFDTEPSSEVSPEVQEYIDSVA